MGFFSKKLEDKDTYQVAVGVSSSGGSVSGEKSSVVQVIRSRFYGKKGKEREDQTAISFIGGLSAAQALSSPSVPVASSPSITSPSRREATVPSTPRAIKERPLPATPPPSAKKRPTDRVPPSPLSRSNHDTPSPSSHAKKESVNTPVPSTPSRTTDTATATLAQRLNELAVANSEGLLNDDEYRLLRQNLFERFASSASVPTETPLVPIATARPRPRKGDPTSTRPTSSRPLSNFQVETPRPASISSRTSAGSAVADLFRRATGRRSGSRDLSDTASVWSSTSNTSFFRLPKTLSKKSSNSSVRTDASRQPDAVSISSRRPGSDRERGDITSKLPATTRSYAGSVRKLATPPSSFPNRALGQETRNMSIYNVFDEDHLVSAKEIQQEILNVEAEARRLMDAFNGLEVTALAKHQRHHVRPSLRSADFGRGSNLEASWAMDSSETRSQRRINLADDAMSMRSGSSSIANSLARSAYSAKKTTRSKSHLNSSMPLPGSNSRPGSLHRKNSTSSMTSDRRSGKSAAAPPVPALPHSVSHGHLKAASSSSASLVRSTGHLPMHTVPEDERAFTIRMEPEEVETEMEDIWRRREEVQQRYESRLEYLRAKLKGAQLHEKLVRK